MKSVRLVLHAIWDLIELYLPQLRKREGYAFLVHPRDISDVYRKYPFLKYVSDMGVLAFLRVFWPVTLSRITGATSLVNGKKISGWVITIPLTAKQMIEDRSLAKKHIVKAAKLARRKGAKIMGLGALTASLSRGGLDVKQEVDIAITTGRIYTCFIVTETALAAMRRVGLASTHTTVAIVGAGGSIGGGCADLMANHGVREIILVDIASKQRRLDELRAHLLSTYPHIRVSERHDIASLIDADIVLAATNHPEALIKSEHLKQGAIVVDDAQPSDIDEEVLHQRNDVLALEGGVVRAPSINTHFNFGLKHRDEIFSCLAEAIILSAIGHFDDFQIGAMLGIDHAELERVSRASRALGFSVGRFQNDITVYTDEDVDRVRQIIESRT